MSKSNTFENDLLLLIFNNTDIANIGDAGGLQNSAAAGDLYVALHTGDPGEAGTAATNAALVQFPECTSGSETITHVSITVGGTPTTADKILYSGALSASRSVSSGIQPQFAASALTITED